MIPNKRPPGTRSQNASFVHKGLGLLRCRSGRRKTDVHRTSCAPTSSESVGDGEEGPGVTRDPACEVVYSRYYQNKCKKSFRMSLGSDTTK